jgi:tetrahydrodipicolinate N-succinyltransferase
MNAAWFPMAPGYGETDQAPLEPKIQTHIGQDVWIGARAVTSAGVTIGTGAVIDANAVVMKDVAPYDIVSGVPARAIRPRSTRKGSVSSGASLCAVNVWTGSFYATRMMAGAICAALAKRERRREAGTIWS